MKTNTATALSVAAGNALAETSDVQFLNQDQFKAFLAKLEELHTTSFPAPMVKDYGYSIVVLSHGFVYAGDVTLVGEELVIGRPLNIRQWGTTKGLGQLAVEGPQKDTVLDRCGNIYAPKLALIHIMSVADLARKRWENRDELKGHG
jgi:hypothetical protein